MGNRCTIYAVHHFVSPLAYRSSNHTNVIFNQLNDSHTAFITCVNSLGIILVVSIRPGLQAEKGNLLETSGGPELVVTSDKILDLVR